FSLQTKELSKIAIGFFDLVAMLEEDDIDSPLESALASFPVRSTGTKNVFLKLSRVDRIVRRIFLRLKLLNLGQARWIDSDFGSFAVAITFLLHEPNEAPPEACQRRSEYILRELTQHYQANIQGG
ncbi:hypothetical protein LTR55_012303, partial [Exophiala xenobiotica]